MPVAFRRLEVEKVILWFNNYFILSGTQEKKIKQHIKLVNGGGNALIFFFFFFGKYLYKVDIVWCDVIGTYILFVCIHTHICDMYVYIYTHTTLSMT